LRKEQLSENIFCASAFIMGTPNILWLGPPSSLLHRNLIFRVTILDTLQPDAQEPEDLFLQECGCSDFFERNGSEKFVVSISEGCH